MQVSNPFDLHHDGIKESVMTTSSKRSLVKKFQLPGATAIAALLIAGGAYGYQSLELEDLDMNQDGVIDEQEAAALPSLQQRFDEFDESGEGTLNREEFDRAMEALTEEREAGQPGREPGGQPGGQQGGGDTGGW
jgi:hypothetical protein